MPTRPDTISKLTLSLHLAYLEYIMAWGNFRKHALAESKLQINYLELKSWKFQKNYAENMVLVETGLLCACEGESCTHVTGSKGLQAKTHGRLSQISGCFLEKICHCQGIVAPGIPVSLKAH